jgi:hypothetical protein
MLLYWARKQNNPLTSTVHLVDKRSRPMLMCSADFKLVTLAWELSKQSGSWKTREHDTQVSTLRQIVVW